MMGLGRCSVGLRVSGGHADGLFFLLALSFLPYGFRTGLPFCVADIHFHADVGGHGLRVKLGVFFALVRELLSLAQRGCCQIISL